jgi:hypothetical protein
MIRVESVLNIAAFYVELDIKIEMPAFTDVLTNMKLKMAQLAALVLFPWLTVSLSHMDMYA